MRDSINIPADSVGGVKTRDFIKDDNSKVIKPKGSVSNKIQR